MALDILAQAEIIKEVITIRDRCDALLAILLPEAEVVTECPHPSEQCEDIGMMGDDEYICHRCGKTQSTPFHSLED